VLGDGARRAALGGIAHAMLDSGHDGGRAGAEDGRGGALDAHTSRGARSTLSGCHGGCCRWH
jgi:hypothetical protein